MRRYGWVDLAIWVLAALLLIPFVVETIVSVVKVLRTLE